MSGKFPPEVEAQAEATQKLMQVQALDGSLAARCFIEVCVPFDKILKRVPSPNSLEDIMTRVEMLYGIAKITFPHVLSMYVLEAAQGDPDICHLILDATLRNVSKEIKELIELRRAELARSTKGESK